MSKISRNTTFVGFSSILIAIIFFSGFYVGNNRDGYSVNGNMVSAGEPVDMEPFWKAWYILNEKYVPASTTDMVSDEDKLYGAISGLTSSFGDPYTTFFPPEENKSFNESINGNFEGVGMEIGIRDDMLVVVSPLKNTPAWNAGIKAGDVISKIDDENSIGMSVESAVKLIRGERGTPVVFEILREGESEPLDITVVRDVIDIPTIDTELRSDGVFVISLYSFNAKSNSLFRNALREFILSKSSRLAIDLRGNPGGYLESAVDLSSWFLEAGKVVVREDFGKNEDERVLRSKGYDVFTDNVKIAILINGGSASASEIMAGALQEHGEAKLFGTQSFGKGSVQELVDITDETSLKVTIARWLTPNGNSISNGGLTPDFVVEMDIEEYKNGVDTQLEAAAKWLLEK